MSIVGFADLVHTGTVIGADNSPLAIGYIAAYAKKRFGDKIDVSLFKYPNTLSEFLQTKSPSVIGFSNYMWNEKLSLAYARAIKKHRPEIITVFGGPNYPINPVEQSDYLQKHPEIDFYVDGEGEIGFGDLYEALLEHKFDAGIIKLKKLEISNIHFLAGETVVLNKLAPRNLNLDEAFPSPYLEGLMDEFFDDTLTPLLQTSRGCPYSCTFCHDGLSYMSKSRRFSVDRVRKEFEYVAQRTKVPNLTLADLNWGMFPDDIETAKDLARLRLEKGWPKFVSSATAKNQKTRVVEMANILGSAMQLGASIQSTDPEVLVNIKRKNIEVDAIVDMAMRATQSDSTTFTEIIVCLAGDTKEKHFKSVFDMLDAGIQDVRTHQLVLLPGTEAATQLSREVHEYKTAFRIIPKSFGRYEIFGDSYVAAEHNEVCIGNLTMPNEDYLECRRFHLTLGIFNNGNIFDEILNLADALKIKRSALLKRIHGNVSKSSGSLPVIYTEFEEDDRKNFFDTEEALETFVSNGGIERYLDGEYGANQLYKYRTKALIEQFEEVASIAVQSMREELADNGLLDESLDQYLLELRKLLIAVRGNLGQLDLEHRLITQFDFEKMRGINFKSDPRSYMLSKPKSIIVAHDRPTKTNLERYFSQHGNGVDGISFFIHRNPARMLYRNYWFDATNQKINSNA